MSASLDVGGRLPVWMLVPFALMLLGIALLPVLTGRWFEHNRNKGIVAAILGVPVLVYLVARFGGVGLELAVDTAEEYVQFIILLLALFTVSGGIYLTGNLVATPRVNLIILIIGAVLASFIGTMGASMVLIRPLLRANSERTHSKHTIVFFIFAVSNVGGLLTPLGDPPLFLGFLRGVPFTWTLRLWPQWLLALVLILLVYTVIEVRAYRKEPARARRMDEQDYVPMRIKGSINILLLLLVIGAVLFSGPLADAGEAIHFPFLRELILVALVGVSLFVGPRGPRKANSFSWGPIVEVAVLFAGIFATMMPALAILQARGGSIGLTEPWHYYWVSGGLSSFLDNAPTYLTFTSVAQGQVAASTVGALTLSTPIPALGASPAQFLAAISCGSVMMGAMSYIGNAPNFAVKCIAEESGLKMPSFFGYMAYSLAVLIPVFLIITAVFFL